MKKTYNAPVLTVVSFVMERGFANSLNGVGGPVEEYEIINDGTRNFGNDEGNNFWSF